MSDKKTARDWFNAYRTALTQLSPEKQAAFRDLPATFDELSDEDKAIFQEMAWKDNLIIGEFEVNQGESDG
jgi:hypothetical protein